MPQPEPFPVIELDRRHTEYGSELEVALPVPTRDLLVANEFIFPDMVVVMAKQGYKESQSARGYTPLSPLHAEARPVLLPQPYSLVRHEATLWHGFLGRQVVGATVDLHNQFGEYSARVSITTDQTGDTVYTLTETPAKRESGGRDAKDTVVTRLDEAAATELVGNIARQAYCAVPMSEQLRLMDTTPGRTSRVFSAIKQPGISLGDTLDALSALSPSMLVTRTGTYPTLQGLFGNVQLRTGEQVLTVAGQSPVTNFEIELRGEQPLTPGRSCWSTKSVELATFSEEPRLRARLSSGLSLTPRMVLHEDARNALLDESLMVYRNSDAVFALIAKHLSMLS